MRINKVLSYSLAHNRKCSAFFIHSSSYTALNVCAFQFGQLSSHLSLLKSSGTLLPRPLGYNLILPSKLCGLGISFCSMNLNLDDIISIYPEPASSFAECLFMDPLPPMEPVIVYAETSIFRISLPATCCCTI